MIPEASLKMLERQIEAVKCLSGRNGQAPMTQEQIAAALVARGLGYRIPLSKDRCQVTICLKSPSYVVGNVYVTPRGEIRTGYTLRASQPVGPQTRRQMLGETA